MRDELVEGLSRDDGSHPYAKWAGAFWGLISLVDLGVDSGDARAVAATERTLEWVASPRRLDEIRRRRIDGRVRRCASMEGRALQHRVVFSHRTGEPAHPTMLKLHFPAYWHYDPLAGLRTLAAAGALCDSRAGDALDLLEELRRPDGAWRAQGRWWKRPGSKGSNVEVVDWGDAANAVLTEQALGVLEAAGRL